MNKYIFLSMMFSVLFVINLYAEPRISVDFEPSIPDVYELDKTIMIGDTIDFDIVAIDVVNLDNYDFKLLYSSAILEVQSLWVTEGPFLSSLGGTVFFFKELRPDTIWISSTLCGTDTTLAPDGSGVICHIRCVAKVDGESALTFADAFFINSYGEVIHVTEEAGNGTITVIPPGIEENAKCKVCQCIGTKLVVYPNPFSRKTVIRVQGLGVSEKQGVAKATQLQIYDLSGRLIRTLSITNHQSPFNQVVWDGKDSNGRLVSTGVYFCQLKFGGITTTKKMSKI